MQFFFVELNSFSLVCRSFILFGIGISLFVSCNSFYFLYVLFLFCFLRFSHQLSDLLGVFFLLACPFLFFSFVVCQCRQMMAIYKVVEGRESVTHWCIFVLFSLFSLLLFGSVSLFFPFIHSLIRQISLDCLCVGNCADRLKEEEEEKKEKNAMQ